MAKGNSGKSGGGGYAAKEYEKAPKDQLTRADIVSANQSGIRDAKTGDWQSYYTPVLQRAYDAGQAGNDLKNALVVQGIRYGKAPESGISHNYNEDKAERGLSLAQEKGHKEIGSSMWFADRKVYEYRGVKVGKGSDGESIILPLHVQNLD